MSPWNSRKEVEGNADVVLMCLEGLGVRLREPQLLAVQSHAYQRDMVPPAQGRALRAMYLKKPKTNKYHVWLLVPTSG